MPTSRFEHYLHSFTALLARCLAKGCFGKLQTTFLSSPTLLITNLHPGPHNKVRYIFPLLLIELVKNGKQLSVGFGFGVETHASTLELAQAKLI